MSERCVFAGQTKPRLAVGRHGGDCDGESCQGCAPCTSRHCLVCGIAHVDEQTCISCLATTRDDLRASSALWGQLLDQALHGGSEGRLEAARPIPGGEALVLLSPTGNPIAQLRQVYSIRTRAQAADYSDRHIERLVSHLLDELPGDQSQPLLVLGTWEDDWRECFGHDAATGIATVADSTKYLDNNLDYAAQRHPAYDQFTADVRRLRGHLEDVLRDGERLQSGAPCLRCNRNLVREVNHDGSLGDTWKCPQCARCYTSAEYDNAVRAAYQSMSVEVIDTPDGKTTWGTVLRAAQDAKRGKRTVETWVREGLVRRVCVLAGRRLMVSVDDARRESSERKRRDRSANCA